MKRTEKHQRTHDKGMHVRFQPEEVKRIAKMAKRQGTSKSQFLRHLVDYGWEAFGNQGERIPFGIPIVSPRSSQTSIPKVTAEVIQKHYQRHPETQRRLIELFPARQIGFTPDNTDARFAACEDLLESKPNPRVKLGQCQLSEELL